MSIQWQRHTHMAEDPRVHGIQRGTGRIFPGMHNRGPQRTVDSQRDKTQVYDETQKIATRSCTPSDPHHVPQAPQQIQRIPKPPTVQHRNQSPTIHAPQNPQPPPPNPQAHSKPQTTPMNTTRPRG